MTKTARRALTVLGALAVALTSTPAVQAAAASTCDPEAPVSTTECPNPWPDDTNVTVCMTDPALCAPDPVCPAAEEFDGTRCVAVQLPTETTGRQYEPTTTAAGPAADPGAAPAASDGERPVDTGAGTAPAAGMPYWVLVDQVIEFLKALFPWAFPAVA